MCHMTTTKRETYLEESYEYIGGGASEEAEGEEGAEAAIEDRWADATERLPHPLVPRAVTRHEHVPWGVEHVVNM